MGSRAFITAIVLVGALFGLGQFFAKTASRGELIKQLNTYKANGLLDSEDAWFVKDIKAELWNKVARVVFQVAYQSAYHRLKDKLHISNLALNEICEDGMVCVFIVNREKDPNFILKNTHALDNAVSFPELKLVIVDEKLLTDLMNSELSASSSPYDNTDFWVPSLKDYPAGESKGGRQVLTLQYMNSDKGIKSPAILLTSTLQDTVNFLKSFTGMFIILHELGHIYDQDNLSYWNGFRPGAELNNIEFAADKFAIDTFDQLKIPVYKDNAAEPEYDSSLHDIVNQMLQLGMYAEFSYLLRQSHGFGIAELFRDGNRLPLKYHLFDAHPPLEYRFLLMSKSLAQRYGADETNPFENIIEQVVWSWDIL
jgi:hypothetical protein